MAGSLLPQPKQIFQDNAWNPLAGGKIFTYEPGTLTPKATYSDYALTTANTNPVIANARGEVTMYGTGLYRIIVKDASDVTVYDRDNVTSENAPLDGSVTVPKLSAAVLSYFTKVTDLAASGGAALVGFIQSGTGAVARTAQDKLRDIVSRSDYDTDANFNTAKVGKLSIDGSGNFDAPLTPSGEGAQIQLAAAVRTVAAGPRDAVMYYNANGVRVYRKFATMGGFRFRGHYTKGRAPTFPMPASNIASLSTDLGAGMTAATFENWYAVFACANDGDAAAALKIMPFLRAGTVSGSNVPLIKAGERIHALTAQTYAWGATDNLAGTECLVITETIDSRANSFSGRVTTITANTTGQVTLASIGSVAAYDFLLPAPPGYDNFVYLGSFYFDTAEVRNIADTGTLVKAKMVNSSDSNFAASGQIATPVAIRMGGYISPLATACVVKEATTISTASTGDFASYFAIDDGGHTVQSTYSTKTSTSTQTLIDDGIEIPFSFFQKIYYSNAGSLVSSRTGATLEITGWIEP